MTELAYTFQGTALRTMLIDTEPWFVLKDICDVLGIQNSRRVYSEMLEDDEKDVRKTYTLGGEQEVQVVNEPGMYTVILRSNSEQARPFRRWVTHDVLPSIRKQGFYSLLTDDALMEVLIERTKKNPDYTKKFNMSQIRTIAGRQAKEDKTGQCELLMLSKANYATLKEFKTELRRICGSDMTLYHKYYDEYVLWARAANVQ